MRNRLALAAALTLGLLGAQAEARAATPLSLNESGRLFAADGTPVTSQVSIVFSFYASAEGGTPVWSETHAILPDDGFFVAPLGRVVAFPAGLFDGTPRYLGLTVGSDTEMVPRQEVLSVPYALVASDATGDLHPASVTVNGQLVINAQGQWVGDTTGLVGPAGEPGPMGPVGPQGEAGLRGELGPVGPAGAQGELGPIGPMGPPGVPGEPGPMGPAGLPGELGPIGPMGPPGFPGLPGEPGPAGPAGPPGELGPMGPIGPAGDVGPTGPRGELGPIGPAGPQGELGPQGPAGDVGPQGLIGPEGPRGLAGATGATGEKGDTGATGAPGPKGDRGPTSVAGCPTGYTAIQLTHSTLCVVRDPTNGTWNAASARCYDQQHGGSLCTHQQLRRACMTGGLTTIAVGAWLADRVNDDTALVTNIDDCGNFDGNLAVGTASSAGQYCCLEWMKY